MRPIHESSKAGSNVNERESRFAIASLIWIPLSFILPFLCVNFVSPEISTKFNFSEFWNVSQFSGTQFNSNNEMKDIYHQQNFNSSEIDKKASLSVSSFNFRPESVRAGIVGTIAAFLILFLWRIDNYVKAGLQKTNEAEDSYMTDRMELNTTVLSFAILWLVWTACGQIILTAHNEVKDRNSASIFR